MAGADGKYSEQHRGDDDSYERYLRGMDQSMRQKIALTAAHLLGEGRVADMGMGSGSGTLALAALYPRVQVVGVDVNPKMVERARALHQLENLDFVQGDIAESVFEDGSLDAIFDSSVLHHVTSFNGYDHEAAARALRAQARQLASGGSLIVRDFVAPSDEPILLDLPADDGDDSAASVDPEQMSSARLLELFAQQFRKLSDEPGFALEVNPPSKGVPEPRAGWRRFAIARRMAAEFLLRKDYRADWDTEVLEEYTYFTQERFEDEFKRLGLRLLASIPIHNPWIVKNRFYEKALLRTPAGADLPFPATNHLIVGEKVDPGDGIEFSALAARAELGFLQWHSFVHRETGKLKDLIRRPGTALDVVPWFRDRGALFVLARKGHPRPVLQVDDEGASLDGAAPVGYVTEPILVLQGEMPVALTVEAELNDVAAVRPEDVKEIEEVAHYYPSPGGIVEEVRAVHVRIEPAYVQGNVRNETGFSTGGRVRAIDARQVLRAAQVGALPDVRLEMNVYELLRRENEAPGPWIGAQVHAPEVAGPRAARFSALARRRAFLPAAQGQRAGFLRLVARGFAERDAEGQSLAEHTREYVVPRELSSNTIAAVIVARVAAQLLIALDVDDLAAAQCFSGSSALHVTPAWRLPRSVVDLPGARRFLETRLEAEYGVGGDIFQLGGKYHPSAGVTPEVVYPELVVLSRLSQNARRKLSWVPLEEVVSNIAEVRDGHLRIGALRAAHALGVFDDLDEGAR